ncbi:MAG: 4-hydroxy-tetrahydrodipicolinate synthase [Anaerolineaceae bacterium 4572_32.2]|nr:MAG: 4-hydroxy-tetrahydrodipicolinate synthase [Anaerolineaceae bacterium 4572_32.2]
MVDKRLEGIIVAMITPFNNDESLDEKGLRAIVRFLIERGVHGLFPAGSQGEFYALTPDERRRVLDITLDEAGGSSFIMAHVGGMTTAETIALARHAEAAGADAVSAITPFFINPSQKELYRHYTDLASAVNVPVLAYNNPALTGINLLPVTTARIVRDAPNFAGLKDSSGDLGQFTEYIRLCPPDFKAFMGCDSLIFAGLTHGAVGVVSASANVVPELALSIYDAVSSRDFMRGRELQRLLSPLRSAFNLGTFPVVIKEALQMIGLPSGPTRRPVASIDDEAREKLRDILDQVGAIA